MKQPNCPLRVRFFDYARNDREHVGRGLAPAALMFTSYIKTQAKKVELFFENPLFTKTEKPVIITWL